LGGCGPEASSLLVTDCPNVEMPQVIAEFKVPARATHILLWDISWELSTESVKRGEKGPSAQTCNGSVTYLRKGRDRRWGLRFLTTPPGRGSPFKLTRAGLAVEEAYKRVFNEKHVSETLKQGTDINGVR